MSVHQFGEAEPGKSYPDRPAAFVVVPRGGLIALVRVAWVGRGRLLHLPGGGIDPGETAAQAAVRECGEEAGLAVEIDGEPFTRADHYFLHHDGVVRNTRGVFFAARVIRDDPRLKVEDDHELVWLEPGAAVARLERPSHAFAVQEWLRLRAGA